MSELQCTIFGFVVDDHNFQLHYCWFRRAITKYQLLSRLLYFSKHVERRVLSSWYIHIASTSSKVEYDHCFFYSLRMDHQYTKLLRMHIRVVMGPCYCLRHRMLHFLQNFVYYMTLEVYPPPSFYNCVTV